MFVPGAMYARCDASVMNVPALAARPPLGATHTMVGSGASSSALTIRWVASRLPPGVFKVTITADEPSAAASSIPCSMYVARTLSTTPVAVRTWALGGVVGSAARTSMPA